MRLCLRGLQKRLWAVVTAIVRAFVAMVAPRHAHAFAPGVKPHAMQRTVIIHVIAHVKRAAKGIVTLIAIN